MNEQLLKTSSSDVLSSRKKRRKTFVGGGGGISSPRHRLYVRGLRVAISSRCIYWLRHFGGKRPNSFWRKFIVRKFSINRFSCLDYVKREITFFDHDTFFTLRQLGSLPWKHNKIMRSTRSQLCFLSRN